MAVARVAALVHPPQCLFELALVAEVFGPTGGGWEESLYEFVACALAPGLVPIDAGLRVEVRQDLDALGTANIIVIPGWGIPHRPVPPAILSELRAAHARGARILALGAGAFVLAATGLLKGRRATTHWSYIADFAMRYPDVEVDPDVLYVDHRDVATSAGMAAGIDLCLHVARADYGAAYANDIGRRMVMPTHREGGQTQLARAALVRRAAGALSPVLDWAVGNLEGRLTVATMAKYAGMSPRTFVRRFIVEVGESPGRWVLTQRIGAAREFLERTDLPVETIARRVGLSSATNLRRHFHRLVGTTPAEYRRALQRRLEKPHHEQTTL
jgi:AraC family transcriptional activator FtrA